MRIDKIEIKNFKGFEDKTFVLDSQFTVFIGDNASGKTSILNALSIAAGSFFLGIEGVDSRTIQENEVRTKTINGQPRPQKPVSIQATWNFSEEEKKRWSNYLKKDSMSWKRELEKTKTTGKDAKEIRFFAESLLLNSRSGSEVIFPILAFYGTGRLWAAHEKLNYQEQSEGVKMAYTYALSAKASPKEFLEWFKTQEDSVKKFEQPLDIAHLNAFKKIITKLIPDDRWQDIAFDNKVNELTGVFTSEDKNKEKLKFSQLSDGFRNMVAIAGDLAYRCIQLNPHLGEGVIFDTPGIVLIDEIDMHLHPNWQRTIVADLKSTFPKIQFVATTHSPFIVQSLGQSELYNLDDEALRTIAPNDLSVNKVVTEIMKVESIKSDDFETRFEEANKELEAIKESKGKLTTEDYLEVSRIIGKIIKDETNDPVLKAYLQNQKDEEL